MSSERLVDIASVPRLRSPQFRSLYANFAVVTSMLHDFNVVLSDVSRDQSGNPTMEELARVILSPSFAKALSFTLAANVKKYEEQHGEIRLPADEGPRVLPTPPAAKN